MRDSLWGRAVLGLVLFSGLCFGATAAQAATTLSFPVAMSEAVTVTGTPRLVLDVGGVTRYATYASGSGTSTLTFTYTTQAGDLDLDGITVSSPLDLNVTGTIKDLNGNDAALTFTPPTTSGIKINHPSLALDFIGNDYILSGTHYATLPALLSAAGGSFTRASIATYFDSSGTLQTATSGTPRFDYDPTTLMAKGLLIEQARTNLVTYSVNFSNAAWQKASASVATTGLLGPDGATPAYKMSEDTSNSNHYMQFFGTGAASTAFTGSFFVKAAERSKVQIRLATAAGAAYVNANLATGVIEASGTLWGSVHSSISATIKALPSGWYRLSLTATSSQTNPILQIFSRDAAGNDSYLGDGTSGLYVWGAQLEAGSFSTSYIPTSSSALFRPAEVLTMPTGAWFSASQGSVEVEADSVGVVSGSVGGVFALNDNTPSNRIDLRAGQAQAFFTTATVNTILGAFSYPSQVSRKFALIYSASVAAASFNGGAVISGTPRLPVTMTKLWLGNIDAGSYELNGHLSQFRYYPLATTTTQLQLLSQ